jgi:hypothetical protein
MHVDLSPMKHIHTIYEFGSFSELIDEFIPVIILLLVFLIGLGIYLYAKYYIDPNSLKVDRRGDQIQIGRKRIGRIVMSITGVVIPFYSFGIGYSYYHNYIAY